MEIKFYIFFICCLLFINSAISQDYLSNLNAVANDPLYSTYAAPLSRSEFIIDQGYHLKFYDNSTGIDMVTDQAGIISLAFKYNGEVRYLLDQMHQQPVITTSYSDLVCYYHYPFSNIRVEIFFAVYSSRLAIQQIIITNENTYPVDLAIYAFIQNPQDVFYEVNLQDSLDGFSFRHHQPPDSWTVSHGVPFVENRQNIYLMDEPFDYYGSYQSLGEPPVPLNNSDRTNFLQNYCVEWGLVYHQDGSLCYHLPPQAQQIIFHDGSLQEILTEDAPKWGDPDPNIPGNGYQGCELGHFRNPPISPDDSFSVIFTCLVKNQQGRADGLIPSLPAPGGVRTDVQLTTEPFPQTPQNVQIQFSSNNNSAVISWDQQPELLYHVYRRSSSTPGRYDLIAGDISGSAYLDLSLHPDSTYGYVVVSTDSNARLSGHSREVGNTGDVSFFDDIRNVHLWNRISGDDAAVLAGQKNISLAPNEVAELRVVRGIGNADSSLSQLLTSCRGIFDVDPSQLIIDDEYIYQNIPRIQFDDPDQEMLYWNAFNLMRQCMLPPEGECSFNYYVFSREPAWGWGHGGQVFHESLTMLAYAFMDPLSAMNSQRVYMERQWPDGYINYRTGPYLNETIPYAGGYTTSAPWFNWENLEIFKIHPDTSFLAEAFQSGKKFYQYWLNHRNSDNDSLCEWGAHAVLESVRDGQVAIWDQVGWPAEFECLDLNAMLVNEAKALSEIALILGYPDDYLYFETEKLNRTSAINSTMWDSQSGFYYHVDKTDHDFSFNSPGDLKRMEIIGFLPLWAGIADSQQAAQLVQHLTDPSRFWRSYGIPTLSAGDSYYNPMGYWNGPVWVQWQYLIF
ncbi:MAG: hypothetical protein JXL67_12195, partial [Calditrichaeota bacterium]|nr:hypothetical protein [Calditrichota bacterium]